MKVGVYVCHCGRNIAGTVNVAEVVQFAQGLPQVAVARDYRYVCSEPGQEIIREGINKFQLDHVVIASCSPRMHELTFSRTVERAGLNPYCLERANIREQCSWVHSDMAKATAKAKLLVASAIAKVSLSQPLVAKEIGVTPAALVIGGGIAGLQSALDLGNTGFKVYLVEREPHLGGHVAQLSKSFPFLHDAKEMLSSSSLRSRHSPT
ncbi:MAG: NAD(P)-binding protein [Chloroflexota bacterium]